LRATWQPRRQAVGALRHRNSRRGGSTGRGTDSADGAGGGPEARGRRSPSPAHLRPSIVPSRTARRRGPCVSLNHHCRRHPCRRCLTSRPARRTAAPFMGRDPPLQQAEPFLRGNTVIRPPACAPPASPVPVMPCSITAARLPRRRVPGSVDRGGTGGSPIWEVTRVRF
jgi:hypothetical protein